MTRVIAILTGIIIALARPALACGPSSGSTFCAESWLAQPSSRSRSETPEAAVQEASDWPSDAQPLASPGEIYVEGAVVIGEAPVPEEEPL